MKRHPFLTLTVSIYATTETDAEIEALSLRLERLGLHEKVEAVVEQVVTDAKWPGAEFSVDE